MHSYDQLVKLSFTSNSILQILKGWKADTIGCVPNNDECEVDYSDFSNNGDKVGVRLEVYT